MLQVYPSPGMATLQLNPVAGSHLPVHQSSVWYKQGPAVPPRRRFAQTTGKKRSDMEKLWQDFFSDPSQWWDHRSEKMDRRFPDFKHKQTQEALWVESKWNPPWVQSKMASVSPGTLQFDAFSWTQKLSTYNKAGQYRRTLELFKQMQKEGIQATRFVFVPIINACAGLRNLEEGKLIHRQIIENGLDSGSHVGNSLIDMYAKCGSIEDAWQVFISLPKRTVVSWSVMILGFVKCGEGKRALELSQQMQKEGVAPDGVTFVGFLNACASVGALEEGRRVHKQIIQGGWETDGFVGSALLDMYVKCGSIEDAFAVFQRLSSRTVVAWNVMISGFAKCGQGLKALELSQQMKGDGLEPNRVTFVALLNACASAGALEEGRRIHNEIIQRGFESDMKTSSSLVDMYAKCGSIEDALTVFNKMTRRDVVAWSAIILGLGKCGQGLKALEIFEEMEQQGVVPNQVTFFALLSACANIGALEEGRRVHHLIIEYGYDSNVTINNSLIDMYIKCRSLNDAVSVFNKLLTRDTVTWGSMILGFVKSGEGDMGMALARQMQQEGVVPDCFTFVAVLNACASTAALDEGRRVHEQVIQCGLESDVYVSTALLDMYAKCQSIEDAFTVFNKMPQRNVIAWNAMLLGYVKCGEGRKALKLSEQMQLEGVEPNQATFVALLYACASLGALEDGRRVHDQIIKSGSESDVHIGNSLVEMYYNCGSVEDALKVSKMLTTQS